MPIPLREESGFGFDLDLLEKKRLAKTKLIVINSPQNPTGGVLEVGPARAHRRDRAPLPHPGPHRRDLQVRSSTRASSRRSRASRACEDLVIILDGFSKAYAMTGWRLGYGVMPAPLAEHVTRLMVNSNSCTASFTQLAGIAALQGDQTPGGARWWPSSSGAATCVVAGLNQLPGVSCRAAARRLLRVPEHQGAQAALEPRWRRRLLQEAGRGGARAARRSASTARATCGSRTPTPRPICARRSTACAPVLARAGAAA